MRKAETSGIWKQESSAFRQEKYRKQENAEIKNKDSIFDAFAGGLLYIADDFDERPEWGR